MARVTQGGVPWLILCKAAQAERTWADPPTLEDFVAIRFTSRAHLINAFRKLYYAELISSERAAALTRAGWKAYNEPLPPRPGALEDASIRRALRVTPDSPVYPAEALEIIGSWMARQHVPLRVRRALEALQKQEEK
jgi:hypothetical protein